MKRWAINLLLLAVVALLGLLVWLTPGDELPPDVIPLTALQPLEIDSIRIDNGKQPAFQLRRRDGGWWMSDPYQVTANGSRISALLDILATPSLERFPLPDGDMEAFGLTPPRPQIDFDGLRLILGGSHPYNHNRYLLIDQTLHLIKDVFPHHFLASAEDFVSTRLLSEGTRIRAIDTPDWQLSRDARGQWRLQPPQPGISADQLVAKVDAWQQARALRLQKMPVETLGRPVTLWIEGREQPLQFSLQQQAATTLLLRRDLGLGYRLPDDGRLLTAPGG